MAFREIPVDQGLFNELVSSNSTRVLARGSWLPHIAQMPDVLQVWGWSDTSTKAAQRVIRSLGPNSSGFKQDEWCLVKRRDGSVV
ncbi:MAG: hypothetical protein OEY20_11060, partial [Gemmatimonadota bacterium]|nr:hypothetical protein [Gemmatimonadota bacterium]